MTVKEVLRKLGLKNKQADIYLACLELGSSTAQNIAKKAGVKRTYFYDLVLDLMDKGLVVQTSKGKKRYFTAVDPDKLKKVEEEKIKMLDEVLPELRSVFNTKGTKPKVTFYEGRAGIDEINNNTLKHKGEQVGFTTEKFLTVRDKKLSREYINKRVGLGIKARVIGPVCNELVEIKKKDKQELRLTKMLPADIFSSDVEFIVYGNKIAIANYKEEFGLIIESSDIAKPLKMIFEIIWRGGFVV